MLKFSLVVATHNRTQELESLLASVVAQRYANVQCILVDQNAGDEVRLISNRWSGLLDITHVTCAPGLSRARNCGLRHASGDIIAFPDDDCWYTPALLKSVSHWFETHPEFAILTVGATDGQGCRSGNRWIQKACEIRPLNVFRTTFSSTIFVRGAATSADVKFDEELGVGAGTIYCCGEETDFVLRLLRMGLRGFYDSTYSICHPKRDMLSGAVDGNRATGYGRGMGYVLAKHSFPLLSMAFVTYDMLRTATSLLRGNSAAASLCFRHGSGLASGYLQSRARLRRDGRPRTVTPLPS